MKEILFFWGIKSCMRKWKEKVKNEKKSWKRKKGGKGGRGKAGEGFDVNARFF